MPSPNGWVTDAQRPKHRNAEGAGYRTNRRLVRALAIHHPHCRRMAQGAESATYLSPALASHRAQPWVRPFAGQCPAQEARIRNAVSRQASQMRAPRALAARRRCMTGVLKEGSAPCRRRMPSRRAARPSIAAWHRAYRRSRHEHAAQHRSSRLPITARANGQTFFLSNSTATR